MAANENHWIGLPGVSNLDTNPHRYITARSSLTKHRSAMSLLRNDPCLQWSPTTASGNSVHAVPLSQTYRACGAIQASRQCPNYQSSKSRESLAPPHRNNSHWDMFFKLHVQWDGKAGKSPDVLCNPFNQGFSQADSSKFCVSRDYGKGCWPVFLSLWTPNFPNDKNPYWKLPFTFTL